MQNTRLSRQFARFTAIALVVSCAFSGNIARAAPQVPNIATFSSPLSYQIYNILAAEMYAHQGNMGQAALHYVAAAQQSSDPVLARRAMDAAISAQDNALSARALARWITLEPNSPEARQSSALVNLRAGKFDEAVADLVSVRDGVDKKGGHGFEFVVSLLALEPQTEKAYGTLKRYVEKEDSSPRAQLALAALALSSDQFEGALQASKTVQQHGTAVQKEQAARLIAKALLGLHRVPEALAELAPLAKTSHDPALKLDYARLLILSDRRADATPFFKQLYKSKPEDADIVYTLGLLYIEQKEYALAEPLIKKLVDMPGHAEDAQYFLGQIYEGEKHNKEALEAYRQAAGSSFALEAMTRAASLVLADKGLDAARDWLHTQYGSAQTDARKVSVLLAESQLLQDAKRYPDAVTVLDSADKLVPGNFEVIYARSLVREKLKDFTGSEADLRILIKQQPDNPTVLNALGYMLTTNTARYAEADGLIRQALKARPNDPAILDSMGWVTYRLGKQAEAEGWLRKAHDLMKDPEIASHFVEVLSALGKHEEAKRILQEMLVKFPNDQMLMQVKEKRVGL